MTQSDFEKCRTSDESKTTTCAFACHHKQISRCWCTINSEEKQYQETNQTALKAFIPTQNFTEANNGSLLIQKCLNEGRIGEFETVQCTYNFTNGWHENNQIFNSSREIECVTDDRARINPPKQIEGVFPYEFFSTIFGTAKEYVAPITTTALPTTKLSTTVPTTFSETTTNEPTTVLTSTADPTTTTILTTKTENVTSEAKTNTSTTLTVPDSAETTTNKLPISMKITDFTSKTVSTTTTEANTPETPTNLLSSEDTTNQTTEIQETTAVQRIAEITTAFDSTIALETSTNPTTTPDQTPTLSVLGTKSTKISQGTTENINLHYTVEVLTTEQSSNQGVSTRQTTEIPQNTPEYIQVSSSTNASSSRSTPDVSQILTITLNTQAESVNQSSIKFPTTVPTTTSPIPSSNDKTATTEESTTSKSTVSPTKITTTTEATTFFKSTRATTPENLTNLKTAEDSTNKTTEIPKTTPLQTKVVTETTSKSTTALETSTNPTTAIEQTSTPSNAVDKSRMSTHITTIGQKFESTSKISRTEQSSTQGVSTRQTTEISQNIAQYIQVSSSTSAGLSGTTPKSAEIPLKSVENSTVDELYTTTSVSPTTTFNPQNTPGNHYSTNFPTNSQEYTTKSTLSAVKSTLTNSNTVPAIASSSKNQFSSKITSKSDEFLSSTTGTSFEKIISPKTSPKLSTEDLLSSSGKLTIFEKALRSSALPTETSSIINLPQNPTTVPSLKKTSRIRNLRTTISTKTAPKRISPTLLSSSTARNNLFNDPSPPLPTNPTFTCRTETGKIIKYYEKVHLPFRERFIYTAKKALPAQMAVGAVFFMILLILKRYRII